MSKAYRDKLRDPRWQRFRLRILERDGWRCTVCKADNVELHVHHTDYGLEPWSIPESCAQTICRDCHSIEHDRIAAEDVILAELVQCPRFGLLVQQRIDGTVGDVVEAISARSIQTSAQLLEEMRDHSEQPRLWFLAALPIPGRSEVSFTALVDAYANGTSRT